MAGTMTQRAETTLAAGSCGGRLRVGSLGSGIQVPFGAFSIEFPIWLFSKVRRHFGKWEACSEAEILK